MSKNYIILAEELDASVEALTNNKLKGRVITRDKLVDYIHQQSSMLYGVRNWIERIDPRTREKLASLMKRDAKRNVSGLGAYAKFKKLLNPKAFADSEKLALEELSRTLYVYGDAMDYLESQITTLFPEKIISIMNMTPKTLALFGVLDLVERLSTFTQLLFHTMATVYADNKKTTPYVQQQLMMNYEYTAALVNNVYDTTVEIDLVNMIANISEVAGTSNIINSDMKVNVTNFGKIRLRGIEAVAMKNAINNFSSIFLPLWELINLLKHNKEKRNAETLEWLQAQVELLNKKMEGMDENDPEYIRLKKIVDKYNDIIAKRMRKEEKQREK